MPDNNQSPQIFPEDANIPPIPSGMTQDTSFPNPIQTITDAPPQEVNTPPKRKFGGRKMIATILGLLVLIGGIAAGIVLVKQQQDIREKAGKAGADCTYNCGGVCIDAVMCPNPDYDATCTDEDCPPGYAVCSCEPNGGGGGGGQCDDGTDPDGCVKYVCPYGDTDSSTTCDEADQGVSWNFYSMSECSSMTCGTQCCQIDWTKNNTYCGFKTKNLSCVHESPPPTELPTSTPTPTATPTPTPTPTPGIDAVCSTVKAYDADWNLLTSVQLSALTAGATIRFTISGTPANQIDKARFTVPGVTEPEVTTDKKPGTDEYYIKYTIPEEVFTFTITAQIHHLILGWF